MATTALEVARGVSRDGQQRPRDGECSVARVEVDLLGRACPVPTELVGVPADGLIGVSCGHRVAREAVKIDGRNLYWCETCGEHRMSGTAGSGVNSFDWLLLLQDEISRNDIVIELDYEPKPHQRAVVEALGATIVVRARAA
jgi:hypothetical protein